jgi:asparagine synthase (glutamine-hydrolysing)
LFKNGLMSKYFELEQSNPVQNESAQIATELKKHLEEAISRRINGDIFGSWLSGGLDSSIIAALARPYVKTLFSFTAGTKDASDIIFAKEASKFIGSKHKEIIVDIKDMIRELPEVIYHLESFDALLVRSSILNYFVAKIASDYVAEVFSGEAGDEFFAGYLYLKSLPVDKLDLELIHISKQLHNTAFQRVDRSASAHGIKAHVVFADPQVFNFALTIPKHFKIFQGVEKWILRQAGINILPETILSRTKAKFWEGSGIGELLYNYAEEKITGQSFLHERKLENGWSLNSKEELMYYRIFKETYGELKNLDWMGRSKKV